MRSGTRARRPEDSSSFHERQAAGSNVTGDDQRELVGCSTGESAGLLPLAPNFFFQRRTAGIRSPEGSVRLRIRRGEARVADQPRRLCVVASDWLRSRELITALRASLCPQEPLEVIMDRRRGGSLIESRLEDRRRQPLVDVALATNGFAIVPASVDPKESRIQVSLLLPEVPTEALLPTDDEDLERLESIRRFTRRRSGRLNALQMVQHIVESRQARPILATLLTVLIGLTLATFALSPAGQNLGKSLVGRMFQGSPPTSGRQAAAPPAAQLPSAGQPPVQTHDASTRAQLPAVTAKPTVAETHPTRIEIPTPRETSAPLKGTGTTSRERGTTSREERPAPRPKKPALRQERSHSVGLSKAGPPGFTGSPRAELARKPESLGWGESYAVRLLNRAGQPLAGAEVWLVARMADGTVENVPMGALPEPGIYRATVPTSRSSPVDLRVRVRRGDKRVEVSVNPSTQGPV
jgi:hypothetical protein